ncbi:MAG TPA: hypothetical protein VKM72_18440 [Thermoanaerobaculia bacterium]|nr:hypothetical protein [Thermoanaerobaculia bacterium]
MVRAVASYTSWIAALIAVAALLTAQGRVASHDDFGGFVQAGLLLVVLCAVGLVTGIVGMLLNLRPVRAALLIPLIGIAANSVLLWYFAPPFLGLAF